MVREIPVRKVADSVAELLVTACQDLRPDVLASLEAALEREESPIGRAVLGQILENSLVARMERIPICQDTGFPVVFLEIGQDVHFTGGDLASAVNDGVRKASLEGFLRKSLIANPMTLPRNTGDNTPSIIHSEITAGDRVKVTVLPKGGGAENASRIAMLTPAEGAEGVRKFVLDTVRMAGPNPCPPLVIGVGVGGTFDYVAFLAKKALLRGMGQRNGDPRLAFLETSFLEDVNKLGIGPAGLGGRITALDLFLEEFPRHLASFPVAVNIQCHAARSRSATI